MHQEDPPANPIPALSEEEHAALAIYVNEGRRQSGDRVEGYRLRGARALKWVDGGSGRSGWRGDQKPARTVVDPRDDSGGGRDLEQLPELSLRRGTDIL